MCQRPVYQLLTSSGAQLPLRGGQTTAVTQHNLICHKVTLVTPVPFERSHLP